VIGSNACSAASERALIPLFNVAKLSKPKVAAAPLLFRFGNSNMGTSGEIHRNICCTFAESG
jgi:hypothetical protein